MDTDQSINSKSTDQGLSEKEYGLIQEFVKTRKERGLEMEYESFDGYELPPRTQFSMLKKPAVSIKYGKLTFSTAAIRLFEGMAHILPVVHATKKRLAVIPLTEEESASVEWSRLKNDEIWVPKTISSLEFVEKLYQLMDWNRDCRYKVLGRVANSDRGLILIFDLEEAIMFTPDKQEYIDPKTGETKTRQVKYFPDKYKDRIGGSYNDYVAVRQMNLFEDFIGYQSDVPPAEETTGHDDPVNSEEET